MAAAEVTEIYGHNKNDFNSVSIIQDYSDFNVYFTSYYGVFSFNFSPI